MLCPDCGTDNIPGVDVCEDCGADLAGLDLPEARGGFSGRLLKDSLRDLTLSQPVLSAPDSPVREAISSMRERRCGCTLVMDGGELVGIFGERHVLTRVVRGDLDLDATPISSVMSPNPLRLSVDDPPAFAVHCMVAYNFRHLPVLEGNELKGYVSVRNILDYIQEQDSR